MTNGVLSLKDNIEANFSYMAGDVSRYLLGRRETILLLKVDAFLTKRKACKGLRRPEENGGEGIEKKAVGTVIRRI